MLYLKEINAADAQKEYAFFQGFPSENGFENGCFGMPYEEFVEKEIPRCLDQAKGVGLRPGHVPSTTFLLWDDGAIVGVFRVRHYLNAALAEGAGHIGYAVHPDYRGRGYATRGLALAIQALKALPDFTDDEIYLRCLRANLPSLRAMLANGGYIHDQNDAHCHVRVPR